MRILIQLNLMSPQAETVARMKTATEILLKRSTLITGLLVFVLALIAYWPVRDFQFINFDDPVHITQNPFVRGGLTAENISWAFRATENASWQPLMWLSFMLDVSLFGEGPRGPHLVNLLLHALDSALVFFLLRRITGCAIPSAFAAAVFAAHPLHVESVAWVSSRKDMLTTLFALSALWFYVDHVEHIKEAGFRAALRSVNYWIALMFFAAALLSKPLLITLPAVMLILDFWPLGRIKNEKVATCKNTWQGLFTEKILFGIAAICLAFTAFLVHEQTGAIRSTDEVSLTNRIGGAAVYYALYFGKTLWPTDLALPYPIVTHWPPTTVVIAALFLLTMTIVAVRKWREGPYIIAGWLFFLITLIPVIGLVQWGAQSFADRFMYVPIIGITIILAWVIEDCSKCSRVRQITMLSQALILGALVWQTRNQLHHWTDSVSLFKHSIAVTKENAVAHICLGNAYEQLNLLDDAERELREALRIFPKHQDALTSLGVVLRRKGDLSGAEAVLRDSLSTAENANAHFYLALILTAKNQITSAKEHYLSAIRLRPGSTEAHNNLGLLWLRENNLDQADRCFKQALQLDPRHIQASSNLARTRFEMALQSLATQKPDIAVQQLRETIRFAPSWIDPLNALAWSLATHPTDSVRSGEEALALAKQAAELSAHTNALVLDTLAAAYAETGQFDDAIHHAERALELATARSSKHTNSIAQRIESYRSRSPWRER